MSSNWLTDEEFAEIDDLPDVFPDADADNEDQPQEHEPAGTPLPYIDPEVAAELVSDSPPTWFGVRWRDIPEADQADAWNGLRVWVDWLVHEHKLPTAVVPPCWYKHSDITAELYAAMCMEYKVWEEQEPGLSPMMFWHTNLQQMIYRLREAVTTAGCVSNGQHKEPMAIDGRKPLELHYDESDWIQHTNVVSVAEEIDRPDEGVLYVRAEIVDDEGEVVAHSEPVGIKRFNAVQEPVVNIEYLSTNGDYSVLQAHWQQYREEHTLIWETSTDMETWESFESEGM